MTMHQLLLCALAHAIISCQGSPTQKNRVLHANQATKKFQSMLLTIGNSARLRPRSMSPSQRVVPQPRLAEPTTEATTKRNFGIPFFQKGVPEFQQPLVQLAEIRAQKFFDWADDDEKLKEKLTNLYLGLMLFISLPVSFVTFHELPQELPNLFVAANVGTFPVMLAFLLRLRIGWGFVSKRLEQKVSYYEAEGAGLVSRKEKEILLRDRLIRDQEVLPRTRRLTFATGALAGASFASLVAGDIVSAVNPVYTVKTIIGDDARALNERYKSDNDFAAEQQRRSLERGTNKPAYCDDQYQRILANGANC